MQSNESGGLSNIKDHIKTIKIYYKMTLIDSNAHIKLIEAADKELSNKLSRINDLCQEIIDYINIRNENK